MTPLGAVGDFSRKYPKPRGIVDAVSDLSMAALIVIGDGCRLVKGL